MISDANEFRNFKEYKKYLKTGIKRLRKLQDGKNSKDDPSGARQPNNVTMFVRFFADFQYTGQSAKIPLLLVGKKGAVSKFSDQIIEGPPPPKSKGKDKEKDDAK